MEVSCGIKPSIMGDTFNRNASFEFWSWDSALSVLAFLFACWLAAKITCGLQYRVACREYCTVARNITAIGLPADWLNNHSFFALLRTYAR